MSVCALLDSNAFQMLPGPDRPCCSLRSHLEKSTARWVTPCLALNATRNGSIRMTATHVSLRLRNSRLNAVPVALAPLRTARRPLHGAFFICPGPNVYAHLALLTERREQKVRSMAPSERLEEAEGLLQRSRKRAVSCLQARDELRRQAETLQVKLQAAEDELAQQGKLVAEAEATVESLRIIAAPPQVAETTSIGDLSKLLAARPQELAALQVAVQAAQASLECARALAVQTRPW